MTGGVTCQPTSDDDMSDGPKTPGAAMFIKKRGHAQGLRAPNLWFALCCIEGRYTLNSVHRPDGNVNR